MAKNVSRPNKSTGATGVPTARIVSGTHRPPQLERLEAFIGRWITEGATIGSDTAGPAQIVASDVYQWLPGGHFVMHPAYGRIGSAEVGGLEVIGYDPSTDQYHTYFFDSQGNVTTETLSYVDGTWTWQGTHARCTAVFSDDGKVLTARHERSDDGAGWVPSMTVTLRKVE